MVAVISVMLMNSETVPVTRTRCPSATVVGQAPQKMKMPFRGRRIGVGVGVLFLEEEARSCCVPWKSPMTTPSTVTVAPGIGVAAPLPWTSWMRATVVVGDRALALGVAGVGAGDVGDVDEEGLVGLGRGVAVDRDVEVVGPVDAARDRLAGQASGRRSRCPR